MSLAERLAYLQNIEAQFRAEHVVAVENKGSEAHPKPR